jgi:hypothetical protein
MECRGATVPSSASDAAPKSATTIHAAALTNIATLGGRTDPPQGNVPLMYMEILLHVDGNLRSLQRKNECRVDHVVP